MGFKRGPRTGPSSLTPGDTFPGAGPGIYVGHHADGLLEVRFAVGSADTKKTRSSTSRYPLILSSSNLHVHPLHPLGLPQVCGQSKVVWSLHRLVPGQPSYTRAVSLISLLSAAEAAEEAVELC